jgi:hypothetical protein
VQTTDPMDRNINEIGLSYFVKIPKPRGLFCVESARNGEKEASFSMRNGALKKSGFLNKGNSNLKKLTTEGATQYLKEWSDYESIRKTARDENFYFFVAKRKNDGLRVVLRFECTPKVKGEYWNVDEQFGSEWSWVDAKECKDN